MICKLLAKKKSNFYSQLILSVVFMILLLVTNDNFSFSEIPKSFWASSRFLINYWGIGPLRRIYDPLNMSGNKRIKWCTDCHIFWQCLFSLTKANKEFLFLMKKLKVWRAKRFTWRAINKDQEVNGNQPL